MLLQPIFLGGATVAVAILQARQSFVLPAIAQVIYTASLILGILATHRRQSLGHLRRHTSASTVPRSASCSAPSCN